MTFSSLDSLRFPKGSDTSCYRQTLLKSSAPERKYSQMRELLVHTAEEKKKKHRKENGRNERNTQDNRSYWYLNSEGKGGGADGRER